MWVLNVNVFVFLVICDVWWPGLVKNPVFVVVYPGRGEAGCCCRWKLLIGELGC